MSRNVDYYYSLQSPWSYLGHERFCAIARDAKATVTPHPVDFGVIFPATGGLPLAKRAPARQAYRLSELKRWSRFLDVPLNLQPRHFPTDETLAAGLVIALREAGGDALQLTGRILRAVWAEERDIADRAVLQEIVADLDGATLLAAAAAPQVADRRKAETEAAIELGVFGAPTYVIDGELFWGQDRLDFVARALSG